MVSFEFVFIRIVILSISSLTAAFLFQAGPMPLRLSDGNYLFIYNSARHNFTDPPKPDYDYQYNVGASLHSFYPAPAHSTLG